MEPLINDIHKLAVEGVTAQRWVKLGQHETLDTFRLRARLLTVSCDMPAEAKVSERIPPLLASHMANRWIQVMHFRGTNALFPFRCYKMGAIRIHSKAPYYITRRTAGDANIDYANLPYREYGEIMQQAYEIETAVKPGIRKKLGMSTGINGQVSLLVFRAFDLLIEYSLGIDFGCRLDQIPFVVSIRYHARSIREPHKGITFALGGRVQDHPAPRRRGQKGRR